MIFNTLKERMEYLRSLSDYKLIPNGYVIVMVDGRGFSKTVKKMFNQPFDDVFINIMNETAKYVCEKVQGVKLAYVQSDEISFIIHDDAQSDTFFNYRLCKIQSIIAGLTTVAFNDLYIKNILSTETDIDEKIRLITDKPKFHFDCKAWNVPNVNDAFAWLLYRQNDCIRNSKQQAAQTYLPKKSLIGQNTDEQIQRLLDERGIDWNDYELGCKYGRIIHREPVLVTTPNGQAERNKWVIESMITFNEMKELIIDYIDG